ncbi:MAG: hypothetical protein U0Q19_21215 [Kineosporiaceae bacterium]
MLTALFCVVVGGRAEATTIDGGTLSLGTPTTAHFADYDDTWTATVAIPAGDRLTLTAQPSGVPGTGVSVRVSAIAPTPNGLLQNIFGAAPSLSSVPGSPNVLASNTSAEPRSATLTLTANDIGDLTFTATLVPGPIPVALTSGTPVPVQITTPGEHVVLTIPVARGHDLGIEVTSPSFSDPGQIPWGWPDGYQLAVSTPDWPSPTLQNLGGGRYRLQHAGDLAAGDPVTIDVSGVGVAIGSLTLTAVDIVDVTGELTLNQPTTVTLPNSFTRGQFTFQEVAGGRLSLQVTASSLVHADGTPGRATATLDTGAGVDQLGTIGATAVTLHARSLSTRDAQGRLTITSDGASTGSITVELVSTPAPITPVTIGTPLDLTIPAHSGARLTFAYDPDERYVLTVANAAFSSPTDPSAAINLWLQVPGLPNWIGSGELPTGDSASHTIALSPGGGSAGTATVILDPQGDVSGTAGVRITRIADVVATLTPSVPFTVRTSAPLEGAVLSLPGAPAGSPLPVFRFDAIALASPSGWATAEVSLQQGAATIPVGYLNSASTTALLTPGPDDGFDPSLPSVLRVRGGADVTMTFTVTLLQPEVTTISVGNGSSTLVRFTGPGQQTRLGFTPRAGQRVVVQRSNDTVGSTIDLIDPTGARIFTASPTDVPGYDEFTPAAAGTPLTLVVRAPLAATGTVRVTVSWISDPPLTGAGPVVRTSWTTGQNPWLSFSAKAGQRPVVQLYPSPRGSWTAQTRIVDAAGNLVAQGPVIDAASRFAEFTTPLPAAGRYRLVIDPDGAAAGSVALQLHLVTDLHLTATSGRPITLNLSSPGQNAVIALHVPDTATLSWKVTGSTVSSAQLRVESASPWMGTVGQASFGCGTARGTFLQPLGADDYLVTVDPVAASTGKLTLTLTVAPSSTTG